MDSSQSTKRGRHESSITREVLVVSEPLCFLFKKFKQLPDKTLKQLITDFYTAEIICEAKNTLLNYMEQLDLTKWTKPTRRRKDSNDKTGSKLKMETEDVIAMLIYIDEYNIYSRLPTFVAADPDNLPSAKLTEGDLQCILNKLAGMSDTLSSFNNLLINSASTITADVVKKLEHRSATQFDTAIITRVQDSLDTILRQTDVTVNGFTVGAVAELGHRLGPILASTVIDKIQGSIDTVIKQTACLDTTNSATSRTSFLSHQYNRQPYSHTAGQSSVNNECLSSGSTLNTQRQNDPIESCSGELSTNNDNNVFQDVGYNRKARKSINADPKIKNNPLVSYAATVNANQPPPKQAQSRRRTVLGASDKCLLKASKHPQIQKSVFKICNLGLECSVSDIRSHVENMKVGVLTCFELPRGKFEKEGNKSFRVCIGSNDKSVFLSKENWSSGILIKEWIFKNMVNDPPEAPNGIVQTVETIVVPELNSVSSYDSAINADAMQIVNN